MCSCSEPWSELEACASESESTSCFGGGFPGKDCVRVANIRNGAGGAGRARTVCDVLSLASRAAGSLWSRFEVAHSRQLCRRRAQGVARIRTPICTLEAASTWVSPCLAAANGFNRPTRSQHLFPVHRQNLHSQEPKSANERQKTSFRALHPWSRQTLAAPLFDILDVASSKRGFSVLRCLSK